jgi:hypothetical protein
MWKLEYLNVSVAHGSTHVCFLDAYISSFIMLSFKVYFLKKVPSHYVQYNVLVQNIKLSFVYRYVLFTSSQSICTPAN